MAAFPPQFLLFFLSIFGPGIDIEVELHFYPPCIILGYQHWSCIYQHLESRTIPESHVNYRYQLWSMIILWRKTIEALKRKWNIEKQFKEPSRAHVNTMLPRLMMYDWFPPGPSTTCFVLDAQNSRNWQVGSVSGPEM